MNRQIKDDIWNINRYNLPRFQIIVADPPWFYNDQKRVRKDGKTPTRGIGACHHYTQMKEKALASFDMQGLMADRCHLYMWATMPLLDQALRLISAWGLTYVTTAFAWIKMNRGVWKEKNTQQTSFVSGGLKEAIEGATFFGPGYYTASNAEIVLLARKGKPFRHAEHRKLSQVVYAPLSPVHSQKPEEIQDRIDYMYPMIENKLELFARRHRPGWVTYGNENE